MSASMFPRSFMRRQANKDLLDTCTISRSEGADWSPIASSVRCSKVVPDQPAQAGEMTEATQQGQEVAEFRVPVGTTVRIGDRLLHENSGHVFTIGGGTFGQTWRSTLRLRAARPTAATPRRSITFFRPNPDTGTYTPVGTYVVQLALSSSQPQINAEADSRIITGWVFSVEGAPSPDLRPGDVFDYQGLRARITSVSPTSELRREATFEVNVGAG